MFVCSETHPAEALAAAALADEESNDKHRMSVEGFLEVGNGFKNLPGVA